LEAYSFQSGPPPSGFSPEFEISLYNEERHRLLQSPVHWQSFYILNNNKKCVSGAIHFHVSEGLAQSPFRSPFGSFESDTEIPAEIIFDFLLFVESSLKVLGVSKVAIKNYPQVYAENEAVLIQTFLLNRNFRVASAEINLVIDVTDSSPADFFHRSAKRRLDKARDAGLTVKKVPLKNFELIYSFIHQCRTEKGYPVSMTMTDLRKTTELFPERFFLFGVFDGDKLVAASITIGVRKNILYDFYHDHAAPYDHLSPVVLLVSGLYEYCQQQKVVLLDLGTSAVDGAPNFPLLHFKKTLGARPTLKLTFEKQIE
jgi:hypothetical protein